jgi:hypothetical protein
MNECTALYTHLKYKALSRLCSCKAMRYSCRQAGGLHCTRYSCMVAVSSTLTTYAIPTLSGVLVTNT